MDWMSDWIRQIILLIFIATIIDLMLPSSSLERYVKLIMGLIIIVSILQPVLQLVLEEDKWSKFSTMLSPAMAADREQSLEKIEANREQLTQAQQTAVQQRLQQSVTDWVQRQVSQQYQVKVVSVEVTVKEKETTPVIEQIVVRADKPTNDTSIRPVAPIGAEQSLSSDDERKLQQQIQSLIASSWNLERKQVIVQIRRS